MIYAFGEYELDTDRHELRHDGVPCLIEPQVFTVLHYLIEHRNQVVPKQELLDHVWPDTFVSESALYQRLRAARRAVGDSGRSQRMIKTVHKQGYRFSARVEMHEPGLDAGNDTASAISERPVVESMPPDAPATSESSPSRVTSVFLDGRIGAERRQVTVLCGSLSNAELLADQLGFEHLERLRQIWLKLAAAEVETYGGVIQPYGEDGFLAFFGLTVAHEDHPRRAVLSGLAICDRLRNAPATLDLPANMGLDVRLGIHTGLVRVRGSTAVEQTPMPVMGETTDLGIRLQSLAVAGDLLVSDATLQLLRGEVDSEPFESVRRGDQRETMKTHLVHGLRRRRPLLHQHDARRLSRFVAREREMAILQASLSQSMSGQGQVVGIMAEAGMGKSRLLYEFAQGLTAHPVTYLEGHCVSYGSATPYLPLLDVLRQLCSILESDTSDMISDKVHQCSLAVGLEAKEVAPCLLQVLGVPLDNTALSGLSPQAIKTRTFATLHRLVLQSSQQRPMILAVENLHWIDPTSEEWLAMLVEELAHAHLSLVCTYRPGYLPQWMDKSFTAQLALARLDSDDSMRVLQSLVTGPLQEAVVAEIVSKADGNPFFLEELAHAVIEGGGDNQTTEIPDTVQAVLAARMGYLSPQTRRLLQMAAVIGRQVPVNLLQLVSGLPEAELSPHLRHLQDAELLHGVGGQSQRLYRFKHALTQDVAYQSLLARDRRQIHRRVGQAMSDQMTHSPDTPLELIAHHYTEAECYEQAVPYWQLAGQRANEQSAYAEAAVHVKKGLEVLGILPPNQDLLRRELALLTILGSALIAVKSQAAPEVEKVYARARQLCQQLGETPQLFPTLMGLWRHAIGRANYHASRELADQFQHIAEQGQEAALLVTADYMQVATLYFGGEFSRAHRPIQRLFGQYDPQRQHVHTFLYGQAPDVAGLAYATLVLWQHGCVDQSHHWVQEVLRRADALSHPHTLARALVFSARLYQLRREPHAVQTYADAAISLSAEQDFVLWLAGGLTMRGWALAEQGLREAGLQQMKEGIGMLSSIGVELWKPYNLALLSEVYGRMGRFNLALETLDEAFTTMGQTGECWWESEMHRLRGELLLNGECGVHDAALTPEVYFQKALKLAQAQHARSQELRATTSLASLWQQQDKCQDAYDLLAPVYNGFTEGFDTADLQEAKALLAVLS